MSIRGELIVVISAFMAMSFAAASVAAEEPDAGKKSDQKTVLSSATAIKGSVPGTTGETYGVAGVSNSPDGAGLGAANTNGGADLVLDGSADGESDAILTQAGLDRPSASSTTFTFHNSGSGVLDLHVEGTLYGNGSGLMFVDAALFGGSTVEEFPLNVELAVSGLSSIHWGNLTNLPVGLADGDDDTLDGLSCTEGQIARWNGAAWVCTADVEVGYSTTHVVGPVGSSTENGAALLDAIANIPTPASQTDARLLKIEPGIYDLGTSPFEMKSWVDVEGSGQGVTVINGSLCEANGSLATTGLIVAAGHAQIRMLSVENTCAGTNLQSVAIFNDEDHARFDRLVLRVSGAADENFGFLNSGDDVELTRLAVTATGASSYNLGIYNILGDRLTVSQSSFYAEGGVFSRGVVDSGSHVTFTDVVATARNGTNDNYGVGLFGEFASLRNVTATASGGSDSTGIYSIDASYRIEGGIAEGNNGLYVITVSSFSTLVTLHNVTVNGSITGLLVDHTAFGPFDVMVNNSSIRGVTNSIANTLGTVSVGGTQLAGGAVTVTGGGVTCAGVWDESYTFSASTCP